MALDAGTTSNRCILFDQHFYQLYFSEFSIYNRNINVAVQHACLWYRCRQNSLTGGVSAGMFACGRAGAGLLQETI